MWRIHCRPINNHTKICVVYRRPSVIYLGGHQAEKRKGPQLKDKQADKQIDSTIHGTVRYKMKKNESAELPEY